MASHIPEDFDSEWDFSDIILHTQNSDGKPLHANKTILATFSPYFRAMLYGNFKEAKEKDINLECDYTTVKEILRIMHHMAHDAVDGQKQYSLDILKNLFVTADMLDVPVVRNRCETQMTDHPTVEMANLAHSLGLHDLLMKILRKMDVEELRNFLDEDNIQTLLPLPIFTRMDVVNIYNYTGDDPLCMATDKKLESPLLLEDISLEVKEPRIDLTEKWQASDIALATKNSQGRILYSNKTVLASFSPYFYKLFLENRVAPEIFDEKTGGEETMLQLDVDYATMKQILSIVHRCSMDFSPKGYIHLHPVLLYDMYQTASKENLDIPIVRKFCCDNLLEQPSVATIEVAVKLGLGDIRSQLVLSMYEQDLCNWVLDMEDGLSYLRDGKEVKIYAGPEEQVLSAADVVNVEKRLDEHYSGNDPTRTIKRAKLTR